MDAKIKPQSLTPYKASNRATYCVTFTDPRTGKRCNRGLATTDPTIAKDRAVDVEKIVNTPSWWSIDHPALHTLDAKAVYAFFGSLPKQTGVIAGQPGIDRIAAVAHLVPLFDEVELESNEFREERIKRVTYERENAELKKENDDLRKDNILLRRAAGLHVKVSLGNAIESWKATYPEGRAERTIVDAFASVASFAQYVGEETPLTQVRAGKIDDWLQSYRNRATGEVVSPVSKRRVKAYVSGFFSWAHRQYDLPENPIKKTGRIPGVSRHPEMIRAFRRYEELATLLKALEPLPYWQAWVAVACLAGPRFSEQVWLKTEDVVLETSQIHITSRISGRQILGTKTGRERRTPIEQRILKPILAKYLSAKDSKHPWLFPSLLSEVRRTKTQVGQWSGSRIFLTHFRGIMKRAKEKNGGHEAFWTFGPKEFRHCFGTCLAHCGYSSNHISQWMGNSAAICEQHYIAGLSGDRWPLSWNLNGI